MVIFSFKYLSHSTSQVYFHTQWVLCKRGKDLLLACVCSCVCVLAALRAYLREGNCHLQQTSRGWRSPASSHGVSGLRHTATRYGATADALIHSWRDLRLNRGACAFSCKFLANGAREQAQNCADEQIHGGTFLSRFFKRGRDIINDPAECSCLRKAIITRVS